MEGQEDPGRESSLLQIQDEIRLAFGWSLEKDIEVAKWLIDEVMRQGYPNWSFHGFDSNWFDIESELLSRRFFRIGRSGKWLESDNSNCHRR